ncbi:MAG TPA: hypothetical protein PJ991_04680 [Kiritimatiellia bacterium]|nr:hypothetical protein [Kiritimatiellia bacterium]
MGDAPVICFGQQPCGFLPRRFLVSKIQTARRIQREIGGRIVYFCHDSDHDYRETLCILKDRTTGNEERINFSFVNKIQKKFTPLFAKKIKPEWQTATARRLPRFVSGSEIIDAFKSVTADNAADFCLGMYRKLGLLDGIDVMRSSDSAFRKAAYPVDDYYVDVMYEGELVRARRCEGDRLRLHQGGSDYIDLPDREWKIEQVSPTRDTRLPWMQSVIRCTHYVAGASEMKYLDKTQAPGVELIPRDDISEPHDSYVP